ncbi:MAG TPA: NUDIX hydrolase [Patescibacteria group bacterium]|nr:NUDIX hydrolase [Patescibacteria group bacterium]
MGRVMFWLTWPGLYLYLGHTDRTRVVVVSDSSILVVKSWLGDGKWSLPGGGLHKREQMLAGAAREVREETGIHIELNQLKELGQIELSVRGIPLKLYCFRAALNRSVVPTAQRGEILEVKWIPLKELLSSGVISADTRRVLLLYQGR